MVFLPFLIFLAAGMLGYFELLAGEMVILAWATAIAFGLGFFFWGMWGAIYRKRPEDNFRFLVGSLYWAPFLWILFSMLGNPTINDVQTQFEKDVPLFSKASNFTEEIPYPTAWQEIVATSYAKVVPLDLPVRRSEVYAQIKAWAEEDPRRTRITRMNEPDFIQIQETTSLLRFKDDLGILLEETGDNGEATRLYFRSRSRVGRSDFGTNARRILIWQARLLEHFTDFDPNKKK